MCGCLPDLTIAARKDYARDFSLHPPVCSLPNTGSSSRPKAKRDAQSCGDRKKGRVVTAGAMHDRVASLTQKNAPSHQHDLRKGPSTPSTNGKPVKTPENQSHRLRDQIEK